MNLLSLHLWSFPFRTKKNQLLMFSASLTHFSSLLISLLYYLQLQSHQSQFYDCFCLLHSFFFLCSFKFTILLLKNPSIFIPVRNLTASKSLGFQANMFGNDFIQRKRKWSQFVFSIVVINACLNFQLASKNKVTNFAGWHYGLKNKHSFLCLFFARRWLILHIWKEK